MLANKVLLKLPFPREVCLPPNYCHPDACFDQGICLDGLL
jgi:hypothetical protein